MAVDYFSSAVASNLGFSVSYYDVNADWVYKTPIPKPGKAELITSDYEKDIYLQIGVFNCGARQESLNERLTMLIRFREQRLTVASFHIKFRDHWLTGEEMTDSDKEFLCTTLEKQLIGLARTHSQDIDSKGNTILPYFDIAFEEIFPELEERVGSKLDRVNKQLHVLRDIFSFKGLRDVRDIKNQSFFTLHGVFPELNRQMRGTDVTGGLKQYLRVPTKYILQEPSRIIRDRDAVKVDRPSLQDTKVPAKHDQNV